MLLRLFFFSEVAFLCSSRLSFEPFVGRVGFRFFLGVNALCNISKNLITQIALFLSCVRSSCDTIMSKPAAVSRDCIFRERVSFSLEVSNSESGTEKRSSTFVFTLFTFWPPAPLLREALKVNSAEKSRFQAGISKMDLFGSSGGNWGFMVVLRIVTIVNNHFGFCFQCNDIARICG